MITINETEYDGFSALSNGQCDVTFNSAVGLDALAALGDTPTINGAEMTRFIYVNYEDAGKTHAGWKAESEAERANGKLDRIRAAIRELSSGIPTIKEYVEFLRAVKEAVGWTN